MRSKLPGREPLPKFEWTSDDEAADLYPTIVREMEDLVAKYRKEPDRAHSLNESLKPVIQGCDAATAERYVVALCRYGTWLNDVDAALQKTEPADRERWSFEHERHRLEDRYWEVEWLIEAAIAITPTVRLATLELLFEMLTREPAVGRRCSLGHALTLAEGVIKREGASPRLHRLANQVLSQVCADRFKGTWVKKLAKLFPKADEPVPTSLDRMEPWVRRACSDLDSATPSERLAWGKLLAHCAEAKSASPSMGWTSQAGELVEPLRGRFEERLSTWFEAAREPKADNVRVDWRGADSYSEPVVDALKGLSWTLALSPSVEGARLLGKASSVALMMIAGVGVRCPKWANACIWSLGKLSTSEDRAVAETALGQLIRLSTRVRHKPTLAMVEKAMNAAAERLGMGRDELDEMGVPSFGFDAHGVREEAVGGAVCTLRVVGGELETEWRNEKGKPVKSPPAGAKAPEHAELLKELKAAAKDAGQMLSAQRERLDRLVGAPREWALEAFRERYLEHGLVGAVARRLIWVVDGTPVLFEGVRAVDVSGAEVVAGASSRVATWHPVGRPVEEVLAWRSRLETLGVTQPFKQAHREVYLLTEAELRTRTYSNRFAAHVIRQHQFNALAAARGWKNKLRLMVDDSYPPASKELPDWGLRAEWWVEGIGEDYGTDTNDSGVFLRLATDQVRFYRTGAAQRFAHASGGGYTPTREADPEPIPLSEVPPLAFSEVMRDVDLFVGVASVGNDPNWQDGGPNGRHRDYWQSYAFGDLAESAKTRREVLARLLPRMTRLAGKWTLLDRFLRVEGKLRAYKIHLGSGNILMEPNDQYLCIVPDSRRPEAPGYVPFEGDGTLSVVLSKALLLIEDDKITDVTITRQLKQ